MVVTLLLLLGEPRIAISPSISTAKPINSFFRASFGRISNSLEKEFEIVCVVVISTKSSSLVTLLPNVATLV